MTTLFVALALTFTTLVAAINIPWDGVKGAEFGECAAETADAFYHQSWPTGASKSLPTAPATSTCATSIRAFPS